MQTLSASRLRTAQSCAARYRFQYIDGLRPKGRGKALMSGKLLHEVLAHFYGVAPGDWSVADVIEPWCAEAREHLGRDYCAYDASDVDGWAALAFDVWQRYVAKHSLDLQRYEVLAVEEPFEAVGLRPHGDGLRRADYLFNGVFDLVVRDGDDLVVMEHKSTDLRSLESAQRRFEIAPQRWGYVAVARSKWLPEGRWPDGRPGQVRFVYNFIRRKIPSVPQLLASGKGLSKRKDIDTLSSVYVGEIVRHGFSTADYGEVLQQLEMRGDTFLYRLDQRPEPHIERVFWTEAWNAILATRRHEREGRWPRSFAACHDFNRLCEFAPICVDPYAGEDAEWRRASLFDVVLDSGDEPEDEDPNSGPFAAPF